MEKLSRKELKNIGGGFVFACKCPGAQNWNFYSGTSWAATAGSVNDCAFYTMYAAEMGEPTGVTCVMVGGGVTSTLPNTNL